MTTTTAKKTTVIEVKGARWDTRRCQVFVGSEFRGLILRDKAAGVWVAYGLGGIKDILGQSKDRAACVEMIVGR